jgi:hypothetical protein
MAFKATIPWQKSRGTTYNNNNNNNNNKMNNQSTFSATM